MWSALSLGMVTALFGAITLLPSISSSLQARIIQRQQSTGNWKTLSAVDIGSGATIPQGRHVFFHIPPTIDTINREVLLGHRGSYIRYWGYCFPEENDPQNLRQSVGFPGKIFLSEAERAWRKAREDALNRVTPFQPPRLRPQQIRVNAIRHQLDLFRGGMTCYIMTEKELPIGSDEDGDELNNQLERQYLTDVRNPDTDGDGLQDWTEVRSGTSPTRRDTDGDGLLDGIEDTNQNGRLDFGETNPNLKDSDGDGLCDGECQDDKFRKICEDNRGDKCVNISYGTRNGEDRNLNGKVDGKETDPRKIDSLGDGIQDDQRYYNCLLSGKKDC